MAGKKASFTQLTHDVVHTSPEPLSFAEIVQKVNDITPITTKNPKSTIRNAVAQSGMIVSTGDSRYGWKPRLINNSLIRHTIQEAELAQNRLYWDYDVWDALWPGFLANKKYAIGGPVRVTLADGTTSDFTLEMFSRGIWGTPATPEFWKWFRSLQAKAGDSLLFKVVDGANAGRS